MRISAELRDHEAAGSLAEDLPYWGWLEDGRTCLTRTGELIAAGCLAPAVVDGRSPEQIDRVLGRWQRLLSGWTPTRASTSMCSVGRVCPRPRTPTAPAS